MQDLLLGTTIDDFSFPEALAPLLASTSDDSQQPVTSVPGDQKISSVFLRSSTWVPHVNIDPYSYTLPEREKSSPMK